MTSPCEAASISMAYGGIATGVAGSVLATGPGGAVAAMVGALFAIGSMVTEHACTKEDLGGKIDKLTREMRQQFSILEDKVDLYRTVTQEEIRREAEDIRAEIRHLGGKIDAHHFRQNVIVPLEVLSSLMRYYGKKPDNDTLSEFNAACNRRSPLEVAEYIKDSIETLLVEYMVRVNYDVTKTETAATLIFYRWQQAEFALAFQLGIKYGNSSQLRKAVIEDSEKRGKTVERIVNRIYHEVREAHFVSFVPKYVQRLLHNSPKGYYSTYSHVADKIMQHLKDHFPSTSDAFYVHLIEGPNSNWGWPGYGDSFKQFLPSNVYVSPNLFEMTLTNDVIVRVYRTFNSTGKCASLEAHYLDRELMRSNNATMIRERWSTLVTPAAPNSYERKHCSEFRDHFCYEEGTQKTPIMFTYHHTQSAAYFKRTHGKAIVSLEVPDSALLGEKFHFSARFNSVYIGC